MIVRFLLERMGRIGSTDEKVPVERKAAVISNEIKRTQPHISHAAFRSLERFHLGCSGATASGFLSVPSSALSTSGLHCFPPSTEGKQWHITRHENR